jgi:hypothetical protein
MLLDFFILVILSFFLRFFLTPGRTPKPQEYGDMPERDTVGRPAQNSRPALMLGCIFFCRFSAAILADPGAVVASFFAGGQLDQDASPEAAWRLLAYLICW